MKSCGVAGQRGFGEKVRNHDRGIIQAFGDLPVGVWGAAPTKARLVPIAGQGLGEPAGILIAALNPYRQLDAGYGGIFGSCCRSDRREFCQLARI